METIIAIENLTKVYDNGYQALNDISLDIKEGEILALLGPNGAGKTTLISTICGLVSPTSGSITVNGFDIEKDYRRARALIGLVPQELTLPAFESLWHTIDFSRGLFGKPADAAYLEQLLKDLSLFEKKDYEIHMLSGGMKRRVLIAKALAHEPMILFLDEPTAGVDVGLRKEMWKLVRKLRDAGVTIILTTHYIEEAEEIADRVGIINDGKLLLVEEKNSLMQKLGKKQLIIDIKEPIKVIPESLAVYALELSKSGDKLTYHYDTTADGTGITTLLQTIREAGLLLKDMQTQQSSLEDIFVGLLEDET